jgi:hypothetical protein
MIPYILYASLVLSACFVFYKLLLQKETFFGLNRFVLLSCMLLAFILPLLPVPQQMSLRKIPVTQVAPVQPYINTTQPAVPAVKAKQSLTAEPLLPAAAVSFEQVMHWLAYLYWFGVIIFAINFCMQAIVLLYKAYSGPVIKDGPFRIVEITGDKAPCSFSNTIFINPEKYDWETYNQVLLHEKIHIQQRHTLDLMFAEIVLMFQWFNPFAWWWRNELENNLEYFTDNQLLQQGKVEKESYQLSLLKVAAPHYPLSLTTNYNQSLLKKRLIMMNVKRSNVHTIWKYFFLLPVMVVFVCLFNEPPAKSQGIADKQNIQEHALNSSNIKTEGNWFATIKADKVNIQFKNDGDENSSNSNTFSLAELSELPRDKEGTFTLTREAGTMQFKGKFDAERGMGRYKFMPDKTFSANMLKEGVDVTAGNDLMVFFLINIKQSYVQMLKKNGYNNLDKDNLVPLAALDVNEAYISSIKQAGFTNIEMDNLVPFRALGIDKAYIDEIRKSGYKDITPDKIITLKAQGIDGKYIADFHSSTSKDIVDVKLSEGDKNKNDEEKNKHDDKDDDDGNDDLIAFKALNIDNAFINSFKAAGYSNISNSDLIAMKALGVTPEYAKSFRDAGYNDIKADDLVGLKSQDVTVALIKEYNQLGFSGVNIEDVIGAKATGTSPSFIKSMKAKGHNMETLDKYISLKAVLGN